MSEKVGNAKGTQLDEEFVDLEKVIFHTSRDVKIAECNI